MNEILESCHLCGTPMGSRAPICPKCFGRADPAAREAIRLDRNKRFREKQEEEVAALNFFLFCFTGFLVVIVLYLVIAYCFGLSPYNAMPPR